VQRVTKFITISRRALKGRINRALQDKHQQVLADRRGGIVHHMLIDTKERTVIATDIDLVGLARKLKVLRPWEQAAT
jgi:hypothetical protein